MPPHPWNDPRPFLLGPDDADLGCLLVHGFTGAPPEVRPLGEHLAARGFRACGVQLPGHGTRADALSDIRWEDWLEAVDAGRRWLDESCDRVVVAGLSMGALLSAVHASRRPPAALILIAPALRIANPLFPLTPLLGWMPGSLPAPTTSGLSARDGWKRLWHYDRRPFRAARELYRVREAAKAAFESVRVPTLVIQGERDVTLDPRGAVEVFDALGTVKKRLVWLPRSGHIATADVEADELFATVDEFLIAHGIGNALFAHFSAASGRRARR